MKNYLKLFFCILLISGIHINVDATSLKLSGIVTEENGASIPFANVYIEGTSKGTTTNIEGKYTLELEPGTYIIVYRFIGFKQKKEQITIANSPVVKDLILSPEAYQLNEVKIVAGAEDPAYAIIRQAQKKRKDYANEVEEYKSNVYIKSTQKLLSYPKKIFGQKVEIDEFVDTVTNIFYLSESVSELSFKLKDHTKEEMISSTVSGQPKAYSFNKASDLLVSFYENLIQIGGLTPRGIVSPISASALFYYDYRLEGTFVENGYTVNKIKVIPKRKSDPVFTGDIFILDDSWRFHSIDLQITTAQQIQVIDTFRIKQSFVPVEKEQWMLFNTQYAYHFSIFGFVGNGIVLGIFSQYQLHPDFPKGYFSGEVLKVKKESNTKDSLYWESYRPVPLTNDEKVDYQRKDSTRVIYESREYLDSMDSKYNKFKLSNIITGYTHSNSFKHTQYSTSSFLENIQFNSVEGWNTVLTLDYSKLWEEPTDHSLKISPSLRYGFSNEHWNGKVEASYSYNDERHSILKLEGGTDVVQFNANNPINPFVNSMYSLLARKNYMKIYEKQYLRLGHESEIFNGVRFGIAGEYADRIPLRNTTSYAIASTGDRIYTSNVPNFPYFFDGFEFPRNQSLSIEGELRIRFKQQYISRPEGKYILGSKYPELKISYKKGIKTGITDTDYDLIRASVKDDIKVGLLGDLTYVIAAGKFLRFDALYFMDSHHFNGNQTWFSAFRTEDFLNLDYYRYSTTMPYLEGHVRHNFGGFLLNKIPLIRKLKLNEVAAVHYLYTDPLNHYTEVSLGIEKLNFIRLEVYTSFAENKRGPIGILFGIRRSIGTQRGN